MQVKKIKNSIATVLARVGLLVSYKRILRVYKDINYKVKNLFFGCKLFGYFSPFAKRNGVFSTGKLNYLLQAVVINNKYFLKPIHAG